MKYLAVVSFLLFSSTVIADTVTYNTVFEGVQVGASTLEDVVERFGKPSSNEKFDTHEMYYYSRFEISIRHSTGKINSILVIDPDYVDPNKISIGKSIRDIESQFNITIVGNYFVDSSKGIIYWFLDGHVSYIVLAAGLDL